MHDWVCGLPRRLLHHTHHKYNKEHTLSPFAGLAFNALDGILQVSILENTFRKCKACTFRCFLKIKGGAGKLPSFLPWFTNLVMRLQGDCEERWGCPDPTSN